MKNIPQKKIFPISLLSLLLVSGCGMVPLPVSIAHTIGDIILNDKTGKTSGEHVLSAATGEDCKFIRIIDTNKICMTEAEYSEYLLSMNCNTYNWDVFGRVSCKLEEEEIEFFGNGTFSP